MSKETSPTKGAAERLHPIGMSIGTSPTKRAAERLHPIGMSIGRTLTKGVAERQLTLGMSGLVCASGDGSKHANNMKLPLLW